MSNVKKYERVIESPTSWPCSRSILLANAAIQAGAVSLVVYMWFQEWFYLNTELQRREEEFEKLWESELVKSDVLSYALAMFRIFLDIRNPFLAVFVLR